MGQLEADTALVAGAGCNNVAVFPASDQPSFVTGDRVLCNGGKEM